MRHTREYCSHKTNEEALYEPILNELQEILSGGKEQIQMQYAIVV